MKKLILIYTLLGVSITAFCQPPACCPKFTLSADFQPCDTNCAQHTVPPTLIKGFTACKNIAHTYTVFPNLPGYTFTWTVLGGTPASITGNPVTITWGASPQGFIQVIITNANGSCKDTINSKVCLVDGPTANFTFAPNPICLNGLVTFTNTSIGGGSYYWDFGDGSFSTLQNPTHIYTSPGNFTVILTVASAGGGGNGSVGQGEDCKCRDTASAIITVSGIQGIDIHTDDCRKMLCTNDSVKYCTSTSCTNYVWSVNGGTILNGQSTSCITVLWNQPSTWPTSVTLTANCASTCGNTATLAVPVLYPNLPIQGSLSVCPASTTTYSLPALPGTFYKWTLSGGGNIVGPDSNINFININWTAPSGSFILKCVYKNPYSGCSGSSSIIITIRPPFKLTGPSPVCLGTTATYTTNGNVSAWALLPNTGFTVVSSGLTSEQIKWTAVGNYTITTTPQTPSNFCTTPGILNVVVIDTPKITPITGPAVVCPNQLYAYKVSSNMNAGAFTWTVTGGGTIVQTMGAHNDSVLVKWATAGTISVFQTVNGCSCLPVSIAVTLIPVPSLTGNITACMDGTGSYSSAPLLPVGSYTWTLSNGLGTIISGQGTNSITIQWHGSNSPGNNTCIITVATCGGIKSLTVTVNTPPAVTIAKLGTLCSPAGMKLTSSLSGSSYQWLLNGSPVGPNNISIIITTPGTYTVLVTQANGCIARGLIVIPPEPLPVASISANGPLAYCPGHPISTPLQALSNPNYCYQWYFNGNPVGTNSPTYTATALGNYWCVVSFCNAPQCNKVSNTLSLVTSGCCNGSCGTSYSMTISNTGCNPVTFTATINPIPSPLNPIQWNFGDGFSGTGTSVTHQYMQAGHFTVCATTTATDANGNSCCISVCKIVDIPLAADFGFVVNCGAVNFSNLSQNLPAYAGYSINWSFPGGTPSSSTSPNPTTVYATSGSHPVTLTISTTVNGNPCTVSITQNVVTSAPTANFSLPSPICALTQAPFNGIGNPAWQYHWDFGDTYASNLQNTTHAYATSGTYNVKLTVTDANGCTDIKSQLITVQPALTVSIGADVFICPGNSVTLTTTPGTFSTYQWYKDGVATVNTPVFTTSATGEYWVTVSNGSGCTATSNHKHVWNYPLPIAKIMGQSVQCISPGGSISLNNSISDPNYVYNWTATGPGSVTFSPNNTSQYISAALSAVGNYQFIITVTNMVTGCSASDTFCLIASLIPTVTVSGPTGSLCEGTLYTFTATGLPPNPNYIYHWSNGITGATMTTAQAGFYTVSITDPISGCMNSAFAGIISKRPYVDLFPLGCDTLCDTVKLIPPLPLSPGQTYPTQYSIQWYVDGNLFFTGSPLVLSSLPLGPHQIYIVVTDLTSNCSNTSGKFNIFIKHCSACTCNESHWTSLNWRYVGPLPDSIPFKCGNNLGTFDCKKPILINAAFSCNPDSCNNLVSYILTGPITQNGFLPLNTSTLPAGNYTLTLLGKCGDSICNRCAITFKIICDTCHCGNNSMNVSLTFNGSTKKVKCGSTLTDISCKDNATLNATYTCSTTGCQDSIIYTLSGPVNNSGMLPLQLNNLQPGSYIVNLLAFCNGKPCDSCRLNFIVTCDTPCCPYHIGIDTTVINYTASPALNATLVTENFNISGLAGVPLTEIRAEVLSYDLSSNFSNECINCKTFPFTWASINTASNIGTLAPEITLFSGSTTPVFNPTGNDIYKNPREVIWNNAGNTFLLGNNPVGIKFILPPASLIDCCRLKGKICVKFSFRDAKCNECEVIVCFRISIAN